MEVLSEMEFQLFRKLICDKCGIDLTEDKAYLIESRLARIMSDLKMSSFGELYGEIRRSDNPDLIQKVIDAITTNETLWFRDKIPWEILENIFLPKYVEQFRNGEREKVRIWSAAASTGQEAYSSAICIDRYLKNNSIRDVSLEQFEIIGSDISKFALEIAKKGLYDKISITRGLDVGVRGGYFTDIGAVWELDGKIRRAVRFSQLNLQNSFATLGNFDVIFCRYVLIYFSEKLKKDIMVRMSDHLKSDGVFFLGSYEICLDSGSFVSNSYKNGVYYTK